MQGGDALMNNDFEFGDDAEGRRCPYAAHIRKSYPRNDITPAAGAAATDFAKREGSEANTQTHRVMRRGIPFGEEVTNAESESQKTSLDRGLMFVCYQTSIEDQFEFIIKNWVNNASFTQPGTGQDPLLGQASGASRARSFVGATINYPSGSKGPPVALPSDFIVPTGGAYLFAPSIAALTNELVA